jgi:iron complex transport system substrate-binding protein
VDNRLIVELKSVDRLAPVDHKILLTYLRVSKLPLGLLMNFGGATFREGIRRVVNTHTTPGSSRLRVNDTDSETATGQVAAPKSFS